LRVRKAANLSSGRDRTAPPSPAIPERYSV
jgi:hypothetical protein